MYLSIGSDMAVRESSVIGIFDMDNTTTSRRTREFLDKAEEEGRVIPCDDLPKAFILTAEYGLSRVHLTTLSASTLERRAMARSAGREDEPRGQGRDCP